MPQIQYPFIDIAVHPAVRAKFAAGEAIALFSRDMAQVLWANGEGARLFGYSDIYDLLDNGPERNGVAFRQMAATARQLETVGDRRSLMIRITAGFSSQAVAAEVSLVEIRRGEAVVIFSAPVAANSTFQARIAAMLKGFDDPDTHMAVIDDQGAVLTASPGFAALGILPETARTLIAAASRSGDGLIKRPIASGAGYLPAAIGRLSVEPPLNLLFCVETVLGRMDPPPETAMQAAAEDEAAETPDAATEDSVEGDVSLPGLALPTEEAADTSASDIVANEGVRLADEAAPSSLTAIADEAREDRQAALPEHIALAADQAEAASAPDDIAQDLPHEDPAATSEAEIPHEDFPAHEATVPDMSSDETNVPAVAPANAMREHENLELAADEAASQPVPRDILAIEPEELASADLAEAAMNDGESEDDVHALAAIDGATADDIEAHAAPEAIAAEDDHAAPPAFADMPLDQAPAFAPAEEEAPSSEPATAGPTSDIAADAQEVESEAIAETLETHATDAEIVASEDVMATDIPSSQPQESVPAEAPDFPDTATADTAEPEIVESQPDDRRHDAEASFTESVPAETTDESGDVAPIFADTESDAADIAVAESISQTEEPVSMIAAVEAAQPEMAEAIPVESVEQVIEAEMPPADAEEPHVSGTGQEPASQQAIVDRPPGEAEETVIEAAETVSDTIAVVDATQPETAEATALESVEQASEADIQPVDTDRSDAISNEPEHASPEAIMDRSAGEAKAVIETAETAADAVAPVETISDPMPLADTETVLAAPLAEMPAEAASTDVAIDDGAEAQATRSDAAAADLSVTAPTTAGDAFEFRRDGRPVRFVWKLDAHGRFSEVSEEFAKTVGPHAGEINGLAYRDLDQLFNLDPSHEIGRLLERRDTWSGRTIRWPVEGTNLVVPVDLAALPTYSRNREFDGFRGFGIIRVADAEEDPHAVGLTLGVQPPAEEPEQTADTQPAEAMADADTLTAESETPAATLDASMQETELSSQPAEEQAPLAADQDLPQQPLVTFSAPETVSTADVPPAPEDEFRGEIPALQLDSNPLAGFSEKIIQLEERRSKGRDGLTANEQNAFREIARRLEPFGKRPNETLENNEAAARQEQEPDVRDAAEQPSPLAAEKSTPAEAAAEQAETTEQVAEAAAVPEAAEAAPVRDDAIAAPETDAAGENEPEDHNEEPHDAPGDVGLTASAADQIPLAILIHAGDRLIHANSEFMRFTGYDSLAALEAAGGLDALIARKEGPHAGIYTIRADGSSVPVSARLQSVHYEGAKLLMLTLMQADMPPAARDEIAEDQEAARRLAALKVESDELRSILETATDGVVVLDTDGRIRSMNRSASALFNFEDSETRGKPFAMLFAHESQKAVQDYLNGLSGHGVASVLNDGREVIGREASGGFIPLFMTMGRMPGSNSYCAVIRDITQWKRSEEELKAAKRSAETANQHKSDFLARVSHEIRTPLNAIIGFSDMIASEHFGPAGHPRYVEYAHDIGRSGRHVLDIVNDLLDISKIEAGEMDLEFSAVGINDCVSEAVSLVQPQANTQRVIIRTSLSQSVPDVVADLRSIKQIAINILANAIRFTPSGGQIVVSTAYEPTGSVALRIRDTGVGMSKSELEQAMKPFGQVAPGARKRGEGTGLGLPLTKAMTEANRALFSIQSSPNEGTLVEIVFPPQRVLAD